MATRKPEIVGVTTDGKLVLSGIFQMRGTYGLPLADVLQILADRQAVPSWTHFYDDAIADGWKPGTIISQLDEALVDVHGPEFRDKVLAFLETARYQRSGWRYAIEQAIGAAAQNGAGE